MEEKYNTERSEKEQLQEKREELETEIRGLVFYFILSSPVMSLENHILQFSKTAGEMVVLSFGSYQDKVHDVDVVRVYIAD